MLNSVSNHSSGNINPYYSQQDKVVNSINTHNTEETEHESSPAIKTQQHLSSEEQQQLQQLKSRDQEVKAHEQAHLSAAGGIATGGASFTYQKGADGVNYAVGGEVSIDTSAVAGDPEATLKKAETIRRAAMAPANPSSQDRAVASQASAMANQARAELFQSHQDDSEKPDSAQTINFSV